MNGRNDRWTDRAAAAAFAVVLGVSAMWGQHDGAVRDNRGAAAMEDAPEEDALSALTAQTLESAETENGEESGEPKAPALDESQKAVLTEIMEDMKAGDLKSAASRINDNGEMLQGLFYEVMEGERYLYDGQGLKTSIEGEGMVFTMPGTVYYGTFKDGRPEGSCMALQAVELDAPRYDYSQGLWKNGMMEGEGHIGYCYYEGSPEGEAQDVCKTGTFTRDLMDGEVTYSTMNGENETSVWKFEVEMGILRLDDRWNYGKEREEYQLMSEDDDSHAYIIGGEMAGQAVWKNLLVWEE